MISVILYGRNDNHGYNYPKRVALNLNCVANLLTDSQDEIIFVDYNTPNDLPTLPQAIEDTLNPETKAKLRIFRVRPEQHAVFAHRTTLEVLEPIARNIGIRRSNPANRWILSSNSDMIYVPHTATQSLNDVVADLPDQCYELPRFELPEYWWEASLSRLTPAATIEQLRTSAKNLHLQLTLSHNNYLLYDNPGDFQLAPREALFAIHGFDEEMLLGWHNDSNLCKRLFLYYQRKMGSLAHRLYGYHCNHNRRATTLLHRKNRVENSWRRFVTEVKTPYLPTQTHWGMVDTEIEEIRLSNHSRPHIYLQKLAETLAVQAPQQYETKMSRHLYNYPAYYAAHVFPFLADHLANLPMDFSVGYLGLNRPLFSLLVSFWQKMGYTGNIFCLSALSDEKLSCPSVKYVDLATLKQANLFIVDFSFDETQLTQNRYTEKQCWLQLNRVTRHFIPLVKQLKKAKNFDRKVISINTTYSDFKQLFDWHIAALDASYQCNLKYGYVKKKNPLTPVKRYLKSAIRYYLCYWFPLLSWRLINLLKGKKLGKYIFLTDSDSA